MEPGAALILHNVAAMHAAPDGGSEQVSQAINGDYVVCLAEENDYVRVRAVDGYEGWIWQGNLGPAKQADGGVWCLAFGVGGSDLARSDIGTHVLDAKQSPSLSPWPFWSELSDQGTTPEARYVSAGIANLYAVPNEPRSLITKLVIGTWLRVLNTPTANLAPFIHVAIPFRQTPGPPNHFGDTEHQTPNIPSPLLLSGYLNIDDTRSAIGRRYPDAFSGEAICALALRFIGTPYLWGGSTPFGFDCSGFVQRLYALHNVVLPRDAYLQARSPLGVQLAPEEPLTAGDLVFFCGRSDPRKRGITHVGVALDPERFIHAYGKQGVIVTRFDDAACRRAYTYVCAWRYRPVEK